MSKTIKIIDLLNKIDNGEEVPKKIEFEGNIYEYDSSKKEYTWWQDEEKFVGQTLLFAAMVGHRINEILNYEVEIIEEQKEIDIPNIVMMDLEKYGFDNRDEFAIDLIFKVNELVQALKKLDLKIKEK